MNTSPIVSSTAAQTNAELKFAAWNSQKGIRKRSVFGDDRRFAELIVHADADDVIADLA